MEFLYVIALLIGMTIIPVMVGARVVGAQNTGFGSALFAVILLAALSIGIDMFVGNPIVAFLASAAGGGFLLAGILGTSFLRGIAVSLIAVAVQVLVIVVFAGAMIGGAFVSG
jgi:hypothetical protein